MSDRTSKNDVTDKVRAAFGFVPNLIAGIVEHNPAVVDAYLAASTALAGGYLDAREKQAVMLAVSAFNDCHYCTAAHRAAAKGLGVSQADLVSIDAQRAPTDERLKTLVSATWAVMSKRGWLGATEVEELGVSRSELYEIISIVGLKTITNYINHIQGTEIDDAFKAQATRDVRKLA